MPLRMTKSNLIRIVKKYVKMGKLHRLNFEKLIDIFGTSFYNWELLFEIPLEFEKLNPENLNLSRLKKTAIIKALEISDFNQQKASDLLGISIRMLNHYIRQNEIKHPNWKKNKPTN